MNYDEVMNIDKVKFGDMGTKILKKRDNKVLSAA